MFKRPSLDDFPYFGNDVQAIIDIQELVPGCRLPDCIPSLDDSSWLSMQQAQAAYPRDEVVLAALLDDSCYAAPLRILNWHEIINFELESGKPVALSFCPLCQTMAAHDRLINGNVIELGVSGLLWNSALVMYDRRTRSLFSQVLSLGIVGRYVNQRLTRFPIIQTSLHQLAKNFPLTKVLDPNTGSDRMRRYNQSPYKDYLLSERIVFPVSHRDDRLHPKELVYTVEANDFHYIIPVGLLSRKEPTKLLESLWSIPFAGSFLFFEVEEDFSAVTMTRLQHLKNPTITDIEEKLHGKWKDAEMSFYFTARAYYPEARIMTAP